MNTTPTLPIGFYDLIFDKAEKNYQILNILTDNFIKNKFRLIKTPLLEFSQNFPNYLRNQQYFATKDNDSNQILFFRNDITPQISRLLKTSLKDHPLPLRICYSGDILKAQSSDLFKDRQITQAGFEIIGSNSTNDIFDVIKLTIDSLKKCQVKELVVEFTLPKIINEIVKQIQTTSKPQLKQAILTKNISKIRQLTKNSLILEELILKIDQNHQNITKLLKEFQFDGKTKEDIKQSQEIITSIIKQYPKINFITNIFSNSDLDYHQKIAFNIFQGTTFQVAKGGCYKINDKIDAIGASIYASNLLK